MPSFIYLFFSFRGGNEASDNQPETDGDAVRKHLPTRCKAAFPFLMSFILFLEVVLSFF